MPPPMPLSGAAALVLVREPVRVGEQLGEPRPDGLAGLLRRRRGGDRRPDVVDERAHDGVSRTNSHP